MISAGKIGVGYGNQRNKRAVFDGFNRADNYETMGSADTGQPWVSLQGTWGIQNGRAINITVVASDFVLVESGAKDVIINCTTKGQLATLTAQRFFNIVFKALNQTNFLMTRVTGGRLELYKSASGTLTNIASMNIDKNVDDVDYHFNITCVGSSIKITVDGTTTLEYTLTEAEASYINYTRCGLRQTVNGTTIHTPSAENFEVIRL